MPSLMKFEHSGAAICAAVALGIVSYCSAFCHADGEVTHVNEVSDWLDIVGNAHVMDFTEFNNGDDIPIDHYADWGIVFANPLNEGVESVFFRDGHGMVNSIGNTEILFSDYRDAIAVLPTNIQRLHMFDGDHLLHSTPWFDEGFDDGGIGFFSDKPFDRIVFEGLDGGAFVDNLYFGMPVPAPGAIGLFAIGAIPRHRRRQA